MWYKFLKLFFTMQDNCFLGSLLVFMQCGEIWRLQENLAPCPQLDSNLWTLDPDFWALPLDHNASMLSFWVYKVHNSISIKVHKFLTTLTKENVLSYSILPLTKLKIYGGIILYNFTIFYDLHPCMQHYELKKQN